MLKRVPASSKLVIAASVLIGLVGMEPLAAYVYGEMAGFEFHPLLWLSALFYWGWENQTVMLSGAAGLAGGIFFPAFVAFALLPPKPLHGSARLARTGEIKRAKMYKAQSTTVLLGRHRGRLIGFNGDLHVFLAAATGTGKGVGFVVPNGLFWGGSLILLDIKGENFTLTSGYRGQVLGQQIFRFDPLNEDGRTHAFNVLDYVRPGDLRVTDVQTIAAILCPPEGNDPYWTNTARDLLMGLLLLVVEAGPARGWPVTIGQVHRLLLSEEETGAALEALLGELDEAKIPTSELCRRYILGFCNEPDKPRGSIKSTLATKLTLWANPLIDRATSRNDFDLRELRRVPTTIYLAIAPDDLARIGQLVRLLIEFFLAANTKAGETPADDPTLNVPVLVLLDEFLSLGKMEKLVQALAYVRGWGIRIATVIQSEAQLQAQYGRELAEFFIDNHRARVIYRPPVHRRDLAKNISELIGMTTVKQTGYSYGKGQRGRNVSETGQAILDADEIANMRDFETIVLVEGLRAFVGEKLFYYKDKLFKKRCLPSLPLPAPIVIEAPEGLEVTAGDAGDQAAMDLECMIERGDEEPPLASAAEFKAAVDALPVLEGMPTDEALDQWTRAMMGIAERASPEALAGLPELLDDEAGNEESAVGEGGPGDDVDEGGDDGDGAVEFDEELFLDCSEQ